MNLDIKYRPSVWGEVVGQDKAVKSLQEQALCQTVSNAYLFTGPSGVGKTTLAHLFAKAANCTNLVVGDNPCNECESCKNFKFWFKHVNGADSRGIAEMRKVMEEMHYKNPYAKYKFIFIDEIASVTKQAFESILTSVEDPPKNVVWMFASVEANRIPKTIRTRCQTFKLNSLSWTDIHRGISSIAKAEGIEVLNDSMWQIARLSGNSMRQAIKVLEQGAEAIEIPEVNNFLAVLGKKKELWDVFRTWKSKYDSFESFLEAIKRELILIIKVDMDLTTGMQPYTIKKYKGENLSVDYYIKALFSVLKMMEKISGVYDYETLSFVTYLKILGWKYDK